MAVYESGTKENDVDRTAEGQSVKYKTKESNVWEKATTELTSDRKGVQAELDAGTEYGRGRLRR